VIDGELPSLGRYQPLDGAVGGSVIEAAVRTNMSPTGLLVSCVVIVVSLGAWVAAVMLAARTPHAKHRNPPRLPGQRQPEGDQLDWHRLERLTIGADDERVRGRAG
jgi:hypothetical protein